MKHFSSHFISKLLKILFVCVFIAGTVTSCSSFPALFSAKQTQTNLSQAEVVFLVTLPAALPSNTTLNLEIVDDITGVAFNPQRYAMTQKDDKTYFVKMSLAIGSVVKYRYIRQADVTTVEYTPQNTQVRFRLASITGPAIVQDNIAAWIDTPYSGAIGRVRGQFLDKSNNAPIPNLLVTAEGVQTVTASDGSFILEGLTPGTHNLVAYSMDGKFDTFSQGVTIAEQATTPVFVQIGQRAVANITFNLTIPDQFSNQLPLRMASNLQSLGNAYADLYSGSTMAAVNLPVLTKVNTGHYQLKLQLPVGSDFRYKYTLGDGFWNGELDSGGAFHVREMIVPDHDSTINDDVATFLSPTFAPVSFVVTTSAPLPENENVSIQFNPFGWFESLPMVRLSQTQWLYTLYSPLSLFGEIEYRFCRNDLCEFTQGVAANQQIFQASAQSQTISTNITEWTNDSLPSTPTSVVTDGGTLSPRSDVSLGFAVDSSYLPFQSAYLINGLTKMVTTGANTVVFSPTWTATRINLPYIEPIPGQDISWNEMQTSIIQAKQANLSVALFPLVTFPQGAATYWTSASRDDGWWISWYDRYHRYMMQVADWASLTGVKTIIIGDPAVSPAMTDGKLANGQSSNAPANADEQWRQLVKDIRAHFSGTILGAVAYPSSTGIPGWLDSVDGLYVLYTPALSQSSNVSVADLETTITTNLENDLYPKIKSLQKPAWLVLNYPSAANAFSGCTDTLGSCLHNWANGSIDLDTQTHIYNAAIIAAAKESWVNGFIAQNNQTTAAIIDNSPSILSKPANDALWFWYHFILNKTS
jgi:hypothetical protein